jgi:hypothetical protein
VQAILLAGPIYGHVAPKLEQPAVYRKVAGAIPVVTAILFALNFQPPVPAILGTKRCSTNRSRFKYFAGRPGTVISIMTPVSKHLVRDFSERVAEATSR